MFLSIIHTIWFELMTCKLQSIPNLDLDSIINLEFHLTTCIAIEKVSKLRARFL